VHSASSVQVLVSAGFPRVVLQALTSAQVCTWIPLVGQPVGAQPEQVQFATQLGGGRDPSKYSCTAELSNPVTVNLLLDIVHPRPPTVPGQLSISSFVPSHVLETAVIVVIFFSTVHTLNELVFFLSMVIVFSTFIPFTIK